MSNDGKLMIKNVVRDGPNPVWAMAKNIALYKTKNIDDEVPENVKIKKLASKSTTENNIKLFGFKKNFYLNSGELQKLILN